MKSKTHRGFSLVEVIIAFSLLTITVIASTNLISDSISNNQENVYRVQAYFLAQEGIELTRAYRDTLWLEGQLFSARFNNEDYTIEFPSSIAPIQLNRGTNFKLFLNNNQFTHDPSGSPTSFTRTINIQELTAPQTLLTNIGGEIPQTNFKIAKNDIPKETKIVTSTVTYEFRGEPKEVSITTILTNWKQL